MKMADELPVKIYKSAERLSIAAPLPGLEPQDIRIDVTGVGQLHIEGRLRGLLKHDKEVLRDEWNPGPYRRTIDLPVAVDATMANATYENGVLVVSLPIDDSFQPAVVALERLSSTQGRRAGNAGHPPRRIVQGAIGVRGTGETGPRSASNLG
jgi:HSP20 family protein